MDHTPQTPAGDDRPLRVLERAPVPDAHKQRLFDLVHRAQAAAAAAGDELQAEFGKEHVALIVGCNQFIRLWKGGSKPGAVELLLNPEDKARLAAAGYGLGEPEGQVFKLFGWVRIDPTQGEPAPLAAAVDQAFGKAKAAKKR